MTPTVVTALVADGPLVADTVTMADSVTLEETARLLVFTVVWTAVWVAPLPRLGPRAELVAGLVPFAAFGLRVFAGFFVGVPAEDPVRAAVSPLVDWIDGRVGFPPYAWVLDATVALGLVWVAVAFEIPRRARIATAWILPAVAAVASATLWTRGMPLERFLAATLPAPVFGLAAGGLIAAIVRWTPAPLAVALRRRAAGVAILTVPVAVVAGLGALRLMGNVPAEHAAQAESIAALAAGGGAALVAAMLGGFERVRSRCLFALAVGVAAGAVVARAGP